MKHKRRVSPSHVVIYIVLILWALTTVTPFLWVVMSSFKDKDLIELQSFSLHFTPTLENYIKTFEKPPQSVWMAYWNSILISGVVTIGVTLAFMFSKNVWITLLVLCLTPVSFGVAISISSRNDARIFSVLMPIPPPARRFHRARQTQAQPASRRGSS